MKLLDFSLLIALHLVMSRRRASKIDQSSVITSRQEPRILLDEVLDGSPESLSIVFSLAIENSKIISSHIRE
jgi:hypothetical protein